MVSKGYWSLYEPLIIPFESDTHGCRFLAAFVTAHAIVFTYGLLAYDFNVHAAIPPLCGHC